MNCQQAQRTISRQLDGEASVRELLALKEHLERCCQCSVFANDLGRLTGVLRNSNVESAPESVTFVVQERLSRLKREGERRYSLNRTRWTASSVLRQLAAALRECWLARSLRTLGRREVYIAAACAAVFVLGLVVSVRVHYDRSHTSVVEATVAASTAQVLTLSAMDPLDDVTIVNNLSRSARDVHAMVH